MNSDDKQIPPLGGGGVKQLLNKTLEQIQNILYTLYMVSLTIPQIKKAIQDGNTDFWFSRNASANDKMDEIIKNTVKKMELVLSSAIEKSHDDGNAAYAEKVNETLKTYAIEATNVHRETTAEKYQTFDRPKLSERVWNITESTKKEIEILTQNAIKEGKSPDDLSKEIKQYLKNPDALFRRVKNKETGELELSEAAKNYKPGPGVYRSAYKNAMRLARTEINAAYRESEWLKYQDDPTVVGIEIQLSNNHTTLSPKTGKPIPFTDICDELAGIYPKTFKWTGWHPQCRCVMLPVLCSNEENIRYVRRRIEKNENYTPTQITQMPKQFQEWVEKNKDRITISNSRGTLPNFVKDNAKLIGIEVNPINTDAGKKIIQDALKKYNSYGDEWEKVYFDEKSGGYVIKHHKHQLDPDTGKFEIKTAEILAKKGYFIEMLDESGFNPQYDIKVNGIPSEIKVMNGFRNIHKRAEEAVVQGAKRVIYYINFDDDFQMRKRFNNVYKTINDIDEIWYIRYDELYIYDKK